MDHRQELTFNQCEVSKKAANCEKLYKENPNIKERQCEKIVQCPNRGKLKDYTFACAAGMGNNLADLAGFLFDDGKMPPAMAEREKFFAECTTPECKRELLGPYVDLFTKEEIEGRPEDRNVVNPNSPETTAHLQGLSAKTLYNRLLSKLQKNFENKTLDEPLIEAWSGKTVQFKNKKTMSEMIEGTLESAGVYNTDCYEPEVLAEMRCYALMGVIDPFMMLKSLAAIQKISGLAMAVAGKLPHTAKGLNELRKSAVAKAGSLAEEIKTFGSNSVFHREQSLRAYPELIKNIDQGNLKALRTTFSKQVPDAKTMESLNWQQHTGGFVKKADVDQMNAQFKNLDSSTKSTIHAVFNKMNDKTAYTSYMEKLSADVVVDIEKTANAQELKALKQGRLSESAVQRVLIQRSQARGEWVQTDQVVNSPSEVNIGPLANKSFTKDKHTVTRMIQEDYVSDVVKETMQGQPKKFWDFLDTKTGRNFWVPLFSSTRRNSLSKPEFTESMNRNYFKP